MENVKVQNASEEPEVTVEGFGIHEARELKKLLSRFMKEYGKKPKEQSDEEWLKQRFLAEMPDMSEEEAAALSHETVESVQEYDRNLASLKEARAKGKTAEEWFADKAQEAASGLSAQAFGEELAELDEVISDANFEMFYDVIVRKDLKAINQNPALFGYIAEQSHVNTFNLAAKVSDSPFYAEVCRPKSGKGYGKNSFDIVIKDSGGQIVHQYQVKYGRTAENTIARIKEGNYNNQTLLVPSDQVEAVQAAFPGKTVVSKIGGTEKVPVSSKPLSEAEAKELQDNAQQKNLFYAEDWNSFDSRGLAKYVGKHAALAGVQAAAIATGFHMAAKIAADEPIEAEEVVSVALETGADAGIKSAAAGAVKVASEKGIIKVIPEGTPMGTIVNVVCVAIENVKILMRVAKGEITMREALDLMSCNTVAMTFGLKWGAAGVGIGIVALGWIPVVGPVIGGVIGGVIGYMAGSKFGQTVYEAAKAVATTAKEVAKTLWEDVKEVGRGVKNFFSGVKDVIFG